MKGRVFIALGGVLILGSLVFSYFELGYALQGSAGAWMVVSALICAGVLGVGMLRAGSGADLDDLPDERSEPTENARDW